MADFVQVPLPEDGEDQLLENEDVVEVLSGGGTSTSEVQVTQLDAGDGPITDANMPVTTLGDQLPLLPQETAAIACVTGYAGRLPVVSDDMRSFLGALLSNPDFRSKVPADRFDVDAWPDLPRYGSFLDDITAFERGAFQMKKAATQTADPQMFLLLESATVALDHAGRPRPQNPDPSGRAGAVYVGVMNLDFKEMIAEREQTGMTASYAACSMLPAQVAYSHNLNGEVMAVDTACSSAAAALFNGIRAVSRGPAEFAVCAGVNAILNVKVTLSLVKAQMISDRSRTFSKDANGYCRGEGVAVIVVEKRHRYAHAEILGSALNNDGRSAQPITKPSQEAQMSCVTEAWGSIPPDGTLLEAHGTGTPTGDPIEAGGLGRALRGLLKKKEDPLNIASCDAEGVRGQPILGALKGNQGHLESAAGGAAMLKMLLQLAAKTAAPFGSDYWRRESSSVDFEALNLSVPLEAMQLIQKHRIRGGVSSFGFGGTNVHVVVAQCGDDASQGVADLAQSATLRVPVILSAPTKEGLRNTAEHFAKEVGKLFKPTKPGNKKTVASADLFQMGATSCLCRDVHQKFRLAGVVDNPERLQELLQKCDYEQVAQEAPAVVMVFGGQGAWWKGMLQKPLQTFEVVRLRVERIAQQVKELEPKLDVMSLLKGGHDPEDPCSAQVLLLAAQLAYADYLASCGVVPDAYIGHSAGEVAAFCAAGYISEERAVRIAFSRGRHQETARRVADAKKGPSGMMAVSCSREDLQQLIKELKLDIDVAVENSGIQCVAAGLKGALGELQEAACAKGHKCTALTVPVAYHSRIMDENIPSLMDKLREGSPGHGDAVRGRVFSTVTGAEVEAREEANALHFVNGVRGPVKFKSAVEACFDTFANSERRRRCICIEVTPTKQLSNHLRAISSSMTIKDTVYLTASDKDDDGSKLLEVCAALWKHGLPINFQKVFPGVVPGPRPGLMGRLPERKFARMADSWEAPPMNLRLRMHGPPQPEHGPVQPEVVAAVQAAVVRSDWRAAFAGGAGSATQVRDMGDAIENGTLNLVSDHRWGGNPIVPGAVWVDFILQLTRCKELHHVVFEAVCPLAEVSTLRAACQPLDGDSGSMAVVFKTQSKRHASGIARPSTSVFRICSDVLLPKRSGTQVEPGVIYNSLKGSGLHYEGNLGSLTDCWWDEAKKTGWARVKVDEGRYGKVSDHALHPALLDAWLQMLGLLLRGDGKALPTGIESIRLHDAQPAAEMLAVIQLNQEFGGDLVFSGALMTLDGHPAATIHNASAQLFGREKLPWLGTLFWHFELRSLPRPPAAFGRGTPMKCLFVGDNNAVGDPTRLRLCAWCFRQRGVFAESSRVCDWDPERSVCEMFSSSGIRLKDFDAVIFPTHGGNPPHALQHVRTPREARAYHTGVMNATLAFHELVKAMETLEKPRPHLWCIVTGDTAASPAGAALLSFSKALVFEDILAEKPEYASKIRSAELRDMTEQSLQSLARELRSPRQDCAELIITTGNVMHPDIAALPFSHSDLLGRREAGRPSGSPFEHAHREGVHRVAKRDGQFIVVTSEDGGRGFADSSSKALIEVKVDRWHPLEFDGRDTAPIDYIQAERDWSAKCMECVVEFSGQVVSVGEDVRSEEPWLLKGAQVVGCAMSPRLVSGSVRVRRELLAPATLVPPNLGLASVAVALELVRWMKQTMEPQAAGAPPPEVRLPAGGDDDRFHRLVDAIKYLAGKMPQSFAVKSKSRLGKSPDIVLIGTPSGEPVDVQPGGVIGLLCHVGAAAEASIRSDSSGATVVRAGVAEMLQEFRLVDLCPKARQALLDLEGSAAPALELRSPRTLTLPSWTPRSMLFSTGGAYLITGALRNRGLGWLMAQWMASMGAGAIVLSGRSKLEAQDRRELEELARKEDCVITVAEDIDLCADDAVEKLAAAIEETGFPLRGIFHGAAVFKDGMFSTRTPESFHEVMAPKILGTLNLHLLSLDERWARTLDFFVMATTIGNVTGNFGQTNYIAANGFQDAFASWRRRAGLPCNAIDWPPLRDIGAMHGQAVLEKQLVESRGIAAIDRRTLLKALEAALLLNRDRVAVSEFSFEQLHGTAQAKNPLVAARWMSLMRRYMVEFPGAGAADGGMGGPVRSAVEGSDTHTKAAAKPATNGAHVAAPPTASSPALPTPALQVAHADAAAALPLPQDPRVRWSPSPASVVTPSTPTPPTTPPSAATPPSPASSAAPPAATPSSLESKASAVKRVITGVLELDSSDWDDAAALPDLGLDSAFAIVARERLLDRLEIDVPLEMLMDGDASAASVVSRIAALD